MQELFPGNLVSRGTAFPFPPRSPDLTICDAFLWGMLKETCFTPIPQTLDQLRDNIEAVIADITPEQCSRMLLLMIERMEYVVNHDGRHVEHVIVNIQN